MAGGYRVWRPRISGMTCQNCQKRIEKRLRGIAGVARADVDYASGAAEIAYDPGVVSQGDIAGAVSRLGYGMAPSGAPRGAGALKAAGAAMLVLAAYLLASRLGFSRIAQAFPVAEAGMGYGMLFVIGLLTSLHCVAMCGGINLSQCLPRASGAGGGRTPRAGAGSPGGAGAAGAAGAPDAGKAWAARRHEIVELLCREEYGTPPPPPRTLDAAVEQEDERFCAGKAALRKVRLTASLANGRAASFPVCVVIPRAASQAAPAPFFVHIAFTPNVPDASMPSEEIADGGFGMVSFCYTDVTTDDGDFSTGLAGAAYDTEPGYAKVRFGADAPGKIALWAWAASRALDYALTLPALDASRAFVVGHSRLGKTALFAGAYDERFAAAISNDSGAGGAALYRCTGGESAADLNRNFPFWFCPNFQKYSEAGSVPQGFDQHFVLAALAPRRVYVAGAEADAWANPRAEYLSCIAASEAFAAQGLPGLCADNGGDIGAAFPSAGTALHGGRIGYHLRPGTHYLSRTDWQRFMQYFG